MRGTICASFAIAVALCACETQQQAVDKMQPEAVTAAQQRGAFELDCPGATAQVLSKEMMQSRNAGVYSAPERAEYTVGVEGCGKKMTYVVVCAQGGTGCVAAGSRANAPTEAAPR